MPKTRYFANAPLPLSFCVREGQVQVTDADWRVVLSIDLATVEQLSRVIERRHYSIGDLMRLNDLTRRPDVIDVETE